MFQQRPRLGGAVADPARHDHELLREPPPQLRVELRGGRRVQEGDRSSARTAPSRRRPSPRPPHASPRSSRSRRRSGRSAPVRCLAVRTSIAGGATARRSDGPRPTRCGSAPRASAFAYSRAAASPALAAYVTVGPVLAGLREVAHELRRRPRRGAPPAVSSSTSATRRWVAAAVLGEERAVRGLLRERMAERELGAASRRR